MQKADKPEAVLQIGWASLARASLIILAAVAVVWILQAAQEVFVPLVLALLISYALEPLIAKLEKFHVPRFLSAAMLLFSLFGLLGFGIWVLSDDVVAIVEQLPPAAERLKDSIRLAGNDGVVEKVAEAASALETTATEAAGPEEAPEGVTRVQIEEKPIDLSGIILWGPVGMLSALSQVALLFFLVYFLLLYGDLFRTKLVRIAGPTLTDKKITVEILRDISSSIARYVLVLFITGTFVGVTSTLAFQFVGLERAPVWGIAAGVFNSVPYFGPIMVAIGLAVVAFLQFGTIEMMLYIVFIAGTITTLEGFLLTPLLIGKAARMNGVAVFVGLLFWSWLWGVWGMLLAAPVLVIIKSICDRVEDLQPIGELLGE